MSHKAFLVPLLAWYARYHRPFPWRGTRDPYKIWVSEIILQQTRAQQGLPYYLRFLERFPTLEALANSTEEELLRCWQGLGYYARARNMHHAARELMQEHNGTFPTTPAALQKIKGIGPYTAAAVASFAFGYPAPVLDGNVFRVLARYFGIDADITVASNRTHFLEKLTPLMEGEDPAHFNQAMMEFGARQCRPRPLCSTCPLQRSCYAFAHQQTTTLPHKPPRPKQRSRYFHYLVFESPTGMLLRRRQDQDIWKGLYDFYLHEATQPLSWAALRKQEAALATDGHRDELRDKLKGECRDELRDGLRDELSYALRKKSAWHKHVLTHQRIMACFFHIQLSARAADACASQYGLCHTPYEEIDALPKPVLITKYLKHEKILLF